MPAAWTLEEISVIVVCPAPDSSVSFSVLHIKSDWTVILSEWMVMVMTNGIDENDNGNGHGDGAVRAWT